MPERDYSKGQIYTIRCRDDPEMVYVGSTINTLTKRLYSHKSEAKRSPNILVYKTIAGNWSNFYIELYELYPCSCKNELVRREGEIMRLIGTLNYRVEGRTQKEYYQQDAAKEKAQQYREKNAEALKEQDRLKYQKNAEALKEKARQRYHKKKAEKEHQ